MGLLCSERGGGTENGKAHAVGVEREKAGHPPRKLEKGFRGELIYNKKTSWIFNQAKLYMKFRITNCCTQLESSGCFCVS